MNYRFWVKNYDGTITTSYKRTLLAAKRAYLAFMRSTNDWKECGFETKPDWEFSTGDAGVAWGK